MSQEHTAVNVRNIVLSMLVETLDQGRFSHIVLNETFAKTALSRQDKLFAARLFHGVLEQVLYLDFIIDAYSKTPVKKQKPVIREILRMGVYQMQFMDAVPDHAAINESVRLARKRGFVNLAPYVNGVLRSVQRSGVPEQMPEHIRYSLPKWLYEKLQTGLGKEQARAFFASLQNPQEHLDIRLLTGKKEEADILQLLSEDGCKAEPISGISGAFCLSGVGDLLQLKAYQEGLFVIQDRNTMQAGETVRKFLPKEQAKQIVDVCAAPGGKSLHIAQCYPQANVLARDISDVKIQKIKENLTRTGIANVCTQVWDATQEDVSLTGKTDLVIADLPCSGLGVIGRKPDIRLRLQEADIASLCKLQREILQASQSYVRPGGYLLYSTCTVLKEENQENTAWFTEHFPFVCIEEKQFLPGTQGGDGFYLALLQRSLA